MKFEDYIKYRIETKSYCHNAAVSDLLHDMERDMDNITGKNGQEIFDHIAFAGGHNYLLMGTLHIFVRTYRQYCRAKNVEPEKINLQG